MRSKLRGITDGRIRPRVKTLTVVGRVLVMALAQMGSLNAMEQTGKNRFWKEWLGEGLLGGSDTTGRVFTLIDVHAIRAMLHHMYYRLKRNKALKPFRDNHFAVIIDGHESSAGYARCCCGCLCRQVKTASGSEVQYYHRHVMAVLLCRDFVLLLDLEMQRPGEDEVAAATRLLERLFASYPRAFDMVIADGLYARANFFKMVTDHGKHAIAVLKDDRRDLFQDAMAIFGQEQPVVFQKKSLIRQCWDIEGFTSWVQLGSDVRVVRSLETKTVRKQITGQQEKKISDWIWATTIQKNTIATESFVEFGHKRWDIENKAFNELVTYWHADHVYKHSVNAIEAFWLVTMLAYNLFHAFINLNLKPIAWKSHTKKYMVDLISAELYAMETSKHPP